MFSFQVYETLHIDNHEKWTFVHFQQTKEIIAFDRQGTQQQRPESPMVTPTGMRVNTRYANSTKGTSSKRTPWACLKWMLLACQVELLKAIQDFVVMSLVCWVLLFSYTSTPLWASFCFRLQQFTLRSTCKCVYVCVYMLSQFRDLRTVSGLEF